MCITDRISITYFLISLIRYISAAFVNRLLTVEPNSIRKIQYLVSSAGHRLTLRHISKNKVSLVLMTSGGRGSRMVCLFVFPSPVKPEVLRWR